jgi:hypothetical protein
MTLRPLTAALLATLTLPVLADPDEGRNLVAQHCQNCHGDEVYTRAERRVQSLDGLQRQVRRCETSLGLTWFDEQIDSTTQYLNQAFYHFK